MKERKVVENTYYRHFKKGDWYKVIGVGKHHETGEAYVLYQAMYGDRKKYIRELSLFLSSRDTEKYPEIHYQPMRLMTLGELREYYSKPSDKEKIALYKMDLECALLDKLVLDKTEKYGGIIYYQVTATGTGVTTHISSQHLVMNGVIRKVVDSKSAMKWLNSPEGQRFFVNCIPFKL